MKFVSLHHHSTFSYMDGFGTPAQHVARASELGMEALALTEHGNVSSHVQLEKAARKTGVKPIFGLEAYTALDGSSRRKFHLTLLATDAHGYNNLMRIVGQSYKDFYHWPTVLGSTLADNHEGIIVLSGCADSLLACSLLGGKTIEPQEASWKRAKHQAKAFKELLGDRFYLETQMFPALERTHAINEAYERMGLELGIPLVATADVHYPQPNDNEMQVILHAAGRGAGSVAAQEAGWEYGIRMTHPLSDKEVLKRLRGTGLGKVASGQALGSTVEIAERCNVVLPKAGRLRYDTGDMTSQEVMWKWLREGWAYRVKSGNRRMAENKEEYLERTNYEMSIIGPKDFTDYFLMISDIVRFAKDSGIPVGPARGSAASSLVCYLLRITEIDPLQYPLMYFERFIALDREDIPDIDLDFDSDRRGEVRAYAVAKYGEERVGNIANYVKFKGKSALDAVGRVFPQVPYNEIQAVKSLIIERSGGDSRSDAALEDTVATFPIAAAVMERWPDLAKAIRLEGNYQTMSIHAAGLVIAERPIAETCALYTRTQKGETRTVVSVDKKDGEYLGLMKVDLLGLSTMSMIRSILNDCDLTLHDLYSIQMDDKETLDAFRATDVVGIFQFEGRATRLVCREVKPDNFLELADINGLSRPGPLFSGTTSDYISIKWGKKRQEKVHPIWDEATDFTKGQIIYQEQVLKMLAEIGGLPVARVHEIRKIISQKLGEAQFNASAGDFIAGAARLHGIEEAVAKHMWGRLVTSATYSFNIAHCISYSMLAFWCMWLKVHYPVQFYAGALRYAKKGAEAGRTSSGGQHTDNFTRLIKDAEKHNVKVRGVGPGSGADWRSYPSKSRIQAGWSQMPGIGEAKAKAILAYEAEHGQMEMDDLIRVNGIGPVMMEKIRAVDKHDPFGLRMVEKQLRVVRKAIKSGELQMPVPRHTSDQILTLPAESSIWFLGCVKHKQYKDFIEDERARSGKTVEEIKAEMKDPQLVTSCTLQCFDEGDEDVYIRFSRWRYPDFKKPLERLRVGYHMVLVNAVKPPSGAFGVNIQARKLWIIDPN